LAFGVVLAGFVRSLSCVRTSGVGDRELGVRILRRLLRDLLIGRELALERLLLGLERLLIRRGRLARERTCERVGEDRTALDEQAGARG